MPKHWRRAALLKFHSAAACHLDLVPLARPGPPLAITGDVVSSQPRPVRALYSDWNQYLRRLKSDWRKCKRRGRAPGTQWVLHEPIVLNCLPNFPQERGSASWGKDVQVSASPRWQEETPGAVSSRPSGCCSPPRPADCPWRPLQG